MTKSGNMLSFDIQTQKGDKGCAIAWEGSFRPLFAPGDVIAEKRRYFWM